MSQRPHHQTQLLVQHRDRLYRLRNVDQQMLVGTQRAVQAGAAAVDHVVVGGVRVNARHRMFAGDAGHVGHAPSYPLPTAGDNIVECQTDERQRIPL